MKQQEFNHLTQGHRTVDQYDQNFMSLRRFAPSLADTEEKQIEKFVLGLNPKTRRMLEAFIPKTYEEALRTAKALEEPPEEKKMEPTVVTGRKRPVEIDTTEFQPPSQRPRYQSRPPTPPPIGRYLAMDKALCRNCRKQHVGRCLAGSGMCYICDHAGHVARTCPTKSSGNPREPLRGPVIREPIIQTRPQTRAYVTTSKEAGTFGTVVTGTLSILGNFALTLFDYGSTHSFVALPFVKQAGFVVEPLMHALSVGTPAGVDLVTKNRVKDGQVVIAGQTIHVDLKVVDMTDFDVILEMDWLAENFASIDCHKKEVIFTPPNGLTFKFKGTSTGTTPKIISMIKARRLIQQEGWTFLACAVNTKGKEKPIDTVPIVNEFMDVFPEDLPRIPPS